MNPVTRSRRSQRADSEIISMETRILPASQLAKNRSSVSLTPPDSSEMDAPPSKRQRIAVVEIVPKVESDLPLAPVPATTKNKIVQVENAMVKTSFARNLGTEMVQFGFGAEKLPSSIHKKVLYTKIPGLKEEIERLELYSELINFPPNMQDAVELLIEWCYVTKLSEVTETTTLEECNIRMKLYCLAEKYGQQELMDQTMDFLTGYLRMDLPRWSLGWASYAYNNTSQGSPLRRLMAKWFTYSFLARSDSPRWTTSAFSNSAFEHRDLVHDVFVELRKDIKVQDRHPNLDPRSAYHLNPSPTPVSTPADVTESEDDSESGSDSESESSDDDSISDIPTKPTKRVINGKKK